MKKNLLFVIPSLSAGGGEKSLINLLTQIDFEKYQVDLLLFNRSGEFISLLPKQVNIIKLNQDYELFSKNLFLSLKGFILKKQVSLAYSRLLFTILSRVILDKAKSEQYAWKYVQQSINSLEKNYDAAIGYLEKSSIYFVVEKVKAKKKIGWIHTNYLNSGMDEKIDRSFFQHLDHLVTVSKECADSLKIKFKPMTNKIEVIYNIVSPQTVRSLANQNVSDRYNQAENRKKIITVARLSPEKGIDLAVKACKILVEKGHRIQWIVLGEGSERDKLELMIKELNLNNHFFLAGVKKNPYPYMKDADIYVQPSRYEGKSIAIDEAKILAKPIVVTDFDSAKDQIIHEVNGLIVEKDEQGIAKGIDKLLRDTLFKQSLSKNLQMEKLGTEEEIQKLYTLIEW
ncbi:glycosyltransferase [Metabacillus sp. GX 13764]|uniref:glycosyltransferase n=1 Tax=Metabacillus kandeliae TaxID=2900151 RepID=UPI001E371C5C|nr:glycosyltransferase [Metabacillus kandeliae]MCD7033151.1 glycosyltransferase [Metabacillus kandeliae]